MKLKLQLGVLLAALPLLFATSCNKDNEGPKKEEGTTHVGITLSMPSDLRDETTDDDYKKVGEWFGKDEIETVVVFIVDKTSGAVDGRSFGKGHFNITPAQDGVPGTNILIKPSKAVRTTPGEKYIYALVNAPVDLVDRLRGFNGTADAFKDKIFSEAQAAYRATQVAQVKNYKDVIMMSNAVAPVALNLEEGVSEAEAISGPKNRALVNVKRVVARVITTTKAQEFPVKYVDGTAMGTVKGISWGAAQGEKQFFISQGRAAGDKIITPAYEMLKFSEKNDFTTLPVRQKQNKYYDYSDLQYSKDNPRVLLTLSDNATAPEIGKKAMEQSVFMFEASHKRQSDPMNRIVSQYDGEFCRGNTAYVLIRAKFVPDAAAFADNTQYQEGQDFFLGQNGRFYGDIKNVMDEAKGGVKGQTCRYYKEGNVYYFAYVNPDDVTTPLDAPIYRNNIYRVNIAGVKNIGLNWNPFHPGKPDGGEDPDDPTIPKNPDPKPTPPNYNPNDDPKPTPDPIDPDDPLSNPEAWLAVEVSVLPWNVHTYDIHLNL